MKDEIELLTRSYYQGFSEVGWWVVVIVIFAFATLFIAVFWSLIEHSQGYVKKAKPFDSKKERRTTKRWRF